jgi:dimethylglycine dehydrogenase
MENYSRRFSISFPNEELPAARPLHTSSIHDQMDAANAVWGSSYGLEYPLWFQRPGAEPVEEVTFHRSNAFAVVAEEVHATRTGVGLMETTGFAKHEFTGPGARAFLERTMANRIPEPGRMVLTPMLNHRGMLIGDFTVATISTATDATDGSEGPERFVVFGSGAAEGYHERWFRSQLQANPHSGLESAPGDLRSAQEDRSPGGRVAYRPLSHEMAGLAISGPAARQVLASLTGVDVSGEAFRFLDVRSMDLGMVPALVARISFTGDLGYEFWVPASLQQRLFGLLTEAGEPHGMRLFGLRALDSMRFDKGFGAWASEYRPIYTPWEARMNRFVKLDKGDFVGREAAAASLDAGPERRLCLLSIDVDDADALGDEPIWHDGKVVGWVTSGGYAHWSEASCALGYLPADLAGTDSPSTGFEVEVLGVRRAATRLDEPLFDPSGSRMRS